MTHAGIAQESQSFSPSALVELYVLDATALGGSLYRFCPSSNGNANVVFDGNTYTAIAFESEGWEWNGKGQFPTPTIRIDNVNKTLLSAVIGFGDLVGATVTRTRTFKKFLDGEPSADPTAIFSVDVYTVERKTKHDKISIEWELSAAMDQFGKRLPGRQILKDACMRTYRVWDGAAFVYTNAQCPYTGTTYFDENGDSTVQASDKCGKRLSDCKKRFGTNGELPFWGFPGAGNL